MILEACGRAYIPYVRLLLDIFDTPTEEQFSTQGLGSGSHLRGVSTVLTAGRWQAAHNCSQQPAGRIVTGTPRRAPIAIDGSILV